jgi:hypothetical protein
LNTTLNNTNCTLNTTSGSYVCYGGLLIIDEKNDRSRDFGAGFTQSFLLIFLSELGDKTFLLVMIYTGKIKYWILFLVGNLAMCGMHTISVLVGLAFH